MHSSSNFKRDLLIFFGLLGLLLYLNTIPIEPTMTPAQLQMATDGLKPGSSLLDNHDNLLALKRPDDQLWQFGYTRKESGVIFKSYYFIMSKVVEPQGKTWTLTDEKKHQWTASTGETWTGDYDLAKNIYGDYRFETVIKRLRDDTIVMLIHPTGYVVYANNNGSVSHVSTPTGSSWKFSYDESDAKKTGGPHKHKPIALTDPSGRNWRKGSGGWTSDDGKEFKGDYSFTEYEINSGLNFATVKRSANEANLSEAVSPTNNTVTYDTKAHKALITERPNSSLSQFDYNYSNFRSSLKWCQEPTGQEYKKDGDNWVTSGNQKTDAKFYDHSELSSPVGYGALEREQSKLYYVWHATGCDIECDNDVTVTAVYYPNGTSRRFWYEKDNSPFTDDKLVKVLDCDGTLWMRESDKSWKSDKGETFNGDFFVDSDLSHNVWGFGTFKKITGSNTEITFSGCPAHVARRECRSTGGGPRGGNDQQCEDKYYVVP